MRKLMVFVLVLLAMLIVGCESESSGYYSPYIGGTKGLELDFQSGSPPEEIFDNGEFYFSVAVQLRNVGESDLEASDGYIELEGISAAEFGISPSELRQDLPPLRGAEKSAEDYIIDGDIDVVSFDDLNYEQNIAGNLDSTVIRAVACYDYSTSASANVCVKDESIDATSEDDVCQVTGNKVTANSGGPIHVVDVLETPQGRDGIRLAFTLRHVGETNDRYFKPGTECDRSVNNLDKDVVYVKVGAIDNDRLNPKCTGFKDGNGGAEGEIRLPKGEDRKVICTYDTSSVNSDFETRVNIEVDYRYMQYIEMPILIKDVSANDN